MGKREARRGSTRPIDASGSRHARGRGAASRRYGTRQNLALAGWLVVSLAGCSSSSDDGSDASMPSNDGGSSALFPSITSGSVPFPEPGAAAAGNLQPALSVNDLETRITTAFVSASQFDVWACTSEAGERQASLFLAAGAIQGESVSHSGATFDVDSASDASVSRFEWLARAADSLQLELADQAEPVSWTNLQFSSEDSFTARNGAEGSLKCNRGAITQ